MKVFLLSVLVALALASGAAFLLERQQVTVVDSYTTQGARVGDPGANLMVDWR